MKDSLNKIIFLIFLLMIFSTNINASVGECANSKKLVETSKADPAGISALMPICGNRVHKTDENGNKQYKVIDYRSEEEEEIYSKSPSIAQTYADEWTRRNLTDIDNKGTIQTEVQICNDENAILAAYVTCKYATITDPIENYCPEENIVTTKIYDNNEACTAVCENRSVNNQSGLITNPNIEEMREVIQGGGDLGGGSGGPSSEPEITCDCSKVVETTSCSVDLETAHCEKGTNGTWLGETGCIEEHDWVYKTTKEFGEQLVLEEARQACNNDGSLPTNCRCDASSIKYKVDCPIYQCTRKDINADICTPSFKTLKSDNKYGSDVYCVNPSQPFTNELSTGDTNTADFIKDETFDVKNCESSFSTVDCGYANILIEGQYNQLNYKVIELALRLWGVHTAQSGFNKVGVSRRRIPDNGTTCTKNVYYMKDGANGYSGNVVNPYVRTYQEFREVLLQKVTDRGYIIQEDFKDFESCDESKLGVACGNNTTYQQAFELLANTILGNDLMQQHLSELFKGEISEDIKSVNLINEINNKKEEEQYIEIHFPDINKVISNTKVRINCKKLDEMEADGKITSAQRAQIEPYCTVQATIVDANGTPLGFGGGTPEYCYKDYCRVKIEKFAICDVEERLRSKLKVRVTYNKSYSSRSISKYVSCSNPADNQIMMGFDQELLESIDKNNPHTIKGIEPITQDFVITNYKCHGKCEDYSLRGEVNEKCSDDTANYNKTYNSNIKDPSLKCILNMGSPYYKNLYDYSEYFGVNPNVCKIYCSDEVEYYIADKVKSISGKKFYYDIESFVSGNNSSKYLFSNIIKEKRTCVSEIYYNNPFTESVDWKRLYNLGSGNDGISDAEINAITNWKTLFNVLAKKAKSERGRTENLNKLLYDLYNCNLYSESEINANGIKRPKNVNNALDNIKRKFSKENGYGFGDSGSCSMTNDSNNCISMKNITYDFGAEPDGKSIEMKSVMSNSNTLDNLVYCSGSNCFPYSEETKKKEYDYPKSTGRKTETINIAEGLYLNGSNKVIVPTNDYVMFEASTQVSFYNSSLFEIKPSGDVINEGSNNTKEKYMKLDAYNYPLSKDAYTTYPTCKSRGFLSDSNRCEITQEYDNLRTYYRRSENDDFSTKVKTSNKFTCYVDVKKPTTIPPNDKKFDFRSSTTYRNIDVSNIFPSSKDGFTTKKNSNWSTDYGKKATLEITNSSNDLITTDDYLEYRITLSPTQIKNIKEYNKNSESYINEDTFNCQIKDNTYQNCLSPFMEELRNTNEYGTIDSKYSTGMSTIKNKQNTKEKN